MTRTKVALVLGATRFSGGGFNYEKSLTELVNRITRKLDIGLDIWESHSKGGFRRLPLEESSPLSDVQKVGQSRGFLGLKIRANKPSIALFEQSLLENGTHLVYFASPNQANLAVNKLPFICTIWDLGHRDLPELPEFWGSTWQKREALFSSALPRAFHTFTDSEHTGKRIEGLYHVSSGRWSALGLLYQPPGGKSDRDFPEIPFRDFFLYPAKRWPHKNHVLLLEAMKLVVEKRPETALVLTGSSEGGAQSLILDGIRRLGLEKNVVDLGFVQDVDIESLTRAARAVVMPSLLGPTNLPPLQALACGTRAIVSEAHFFDEDIQSRLTVVPGYSAQSWADQMIGALKLPGVDPFNPGIRIVEDEITAVLENFRSRSKLYMAV